MNATCLVNSYNYRDHVVEAVESALNQTVAFERVVIVDDGSTDGTPALLRERFGDDPRVELIEKPNGGQLSCFNVGVGAVETEFVFFLDADDRYHADYLETALTTYADRPEVDFLSVAPSPIGGELSRKPSRTRDLGISVQAALQGSQWLGERTSCLSLRTATARRILPYPHEDDWRSRADDVLTYGASVVGAYKRHLEQPLVDYRIHAHNAFAGRSFQSVTAVRRSLAVNRLLHWYAEREGYNLLTLPTCLHREFRTREAPSLAELAFYLKLSMRSRLPLSTRLRHLAAMTAHWVKSPRWEAEKYRVRAPSQREAAPNAKAA